MEFLHSFLRRHLVEKPVVASPNVGCVLRLTRNTILTRAKNDTVFNPLSANGDRHQFSPNHIQRL